MSARKLGRFAGLVLVLAAILGGVSAQHHDGAQNSAVPANTQVIDWT